MKSTVCLHFPGYVIKFQIPCEKKEEEGNEQIELSNYKLPLPLESYVKPPRPLVNTDLMEELSRDKPTGNFKEMCLKKIGLFSSPQIFNFTKKNHCCFCCGKK